MVSENITWRVEPVGVFQGREMVRHPTLLGLATHTLDVQHNSASELQSACSGPAVCIQQPCMDNGRSCVLVLHRPLRSCASRAAAATFAAQRQDSLTLLSRRTSMFETGHPWLTWRHAKLAALQLILGSGLLHTTVSPAGG